MGGGMARRLLSVGWPVHVHDKEAATQQVLQAAGAHGCDSPAAIAKAAESVIVCVIDAVQVQEVLDGPAGLLAHLQAGQTVIMCPTLAPAQTEDFARQLQAIGVHMVDAPMSGGPIRAANGSMSLMTAAPVEVLAAQNELLTTLSEQCVFISHKVGDGTRVKLVNNMLAMSYSRESEAEADAHAMKALGGANISPIGTASFFDRLSEMDGSASSSTSDNGIAGYMSSHPLSRSRKDAFEKSIVKGKNYKPALTPTEWTELKTMCTQDRKAKSGFGFDFN